MVLIVHILSDSTASTYEPNRAPRTGWGQVFGDVSGLDVRNHAVSGMSTTSLIASGTLAAALTQVQAGDLVLVAFGHNDAKADERYADPIHAYPANLRLITDAVRARDAAPVLLTPVERRLFVDGRAGHTHGLYPAAVRTLAASENTPLIDLTASSRALWQEQGAEASKSSFLWLLPGQWPGYPEGERDDTHLSWTGAMAVARLVAEGLTTTGLLSAVDRSSS